MNLSAVAILLLLIIITLGLTELVARLGKKAAFISRKFLHFVGVGCLAISPVFFESYWLLFFVVAFFAIILFIVVYKHWLVTDIYNRSSWGIALFPLSFLVLWLFFGRSQPWLVIYPMLLLAIADAAAAIFGNLLGQHFYTVSGDYKSMLGSYVFSIFSFLTLAFLPDLLERFHPYFALEFPGGTDQVDRLLIFAIITFFAAAAEGATSGGWDNVTVPLSVGWLLAVLPGFDDFSLQIALPVFYLMAGLGFFAWYRKWLNPGGAVVAAMLGFVIWTASDWRTLTLIGLFFVSSSFMGRLNKKRYGTSDPKWGLPRDYTQVLSNGGIAGICMLWYGLNPGEVPLTLFALSVAISTADTWSSEFGIWSGGWVYDIVGLKPLQKGISGGISWQGTLAGMAGATFIGLAAFLLLDIPNPFWIVLGGTAGMLVDSVMGSLWQVRYVWRRGEEYILAEDWMYGEKMELQKGYRWMTNDRVNLLSNLIVTLAGGILLYFLGKG